MPDLLGGVGSYLLLARHLASPQAVYAVQGRGLVGAERPLTTIGGMAAHGIRELRKLQPHGPYHLAGASFAGLIAFEAARQLRAQGEEVALVALFDTWLPYNPATPGPVLYVQTLVRRLSRRAGSWLQHARRSARHLAHAAPRSRKAKLAYLRARLVAAARAGRPRPQAPRRPLFVDLETRHNRILGASRLALVSYRPARYAGRLLYFCATDHTGAPSFDQYQAWSALAAGGIDCCRLPGNHHVLLGEPLVRTVADVLAAHLPTQPP